MSLKKVPLIFLLFVVNSALSGNQEKIIKDALGFPYALSSPPQRIVSLAPNITEILFSLDLGEKVVGVTRYCDYPAEAQEKEKIGGMIDPSLEEIKALNPDLVIGFRGNPLKAIKRLRGLNLPVFVLEIGNDFESLFLLIKKIGIITAEEKKAEMLIKSLRKKFDEVQSALKNVRHEPKVFFSIHGMGLWTCGKESFLNDLVRRARGINIAGNIPKKWLLYNQEQFIYEDPEAIVILSKTEEEFSKARDWIKNKKHFKRIKAVEMDKIYFLDENLAARPGPRLIDALLELARLLHPEYLEIDR